ncbi:hypothetical protein [uncultured Parabacteroides sp.]|uniref:hypothetical protein n=1 Tax=uncultured Parabacteroides sp. TaxID=512312 RepID=UPI0026143795|nr:hypothetical protein [uncultured Parabacteroides sp.]
MKLKNIALGIGFLVAMFSCSMEDDIAPNMGGEVEGVSEDVYAALQFNISAGTELNTKATTGVTESEDSDYSEMENSTEMAVNECFVFVANGDDIIGRRHYESADITRSATDKNKYTLNKHILVKVSNEKPVLTVFAVGMKSDNADTFANGLYLSATSLKSLKQSTVGKNHQDKGNSLTDFIKVGEGTIKPYDQDQTNGYQTSNKTTDFACNENGTVRCGLTDIALGLRAAAIELMSFKVVTVGGTTLADLVTSHNGKNNEGEINSITKNGNADITAPQIRAIVKDVIISPQVVNTVLYPTDEKKELSESDKVFAGNDGGNTSFMIAYNDKVEKANGDAAKITQIESSSHPLNHRFYTYQNANATDHKTKVTIKYEVEGIPGECTFFVKTGGIGDDAAKVLAGNLYQLHVTITNAVATIKVVTKDWKYNKVEQEMQEVIK